MIYKVGSPKSDMVARIQEFLGCKPVDGLFGPKTKAAVQAFQREKGLKVDGVVGPQTLALMFPKNGENMLTQEVGQTEFVLTQKAPQTSRTITHIFVHCTGGDQSTTPKQLLDYFYKQKGWSRPGYHYVVSADGKVTQLWPESKYSNGVKNMNSHSINIAWIGGVDKKHPDGFDNRTQAQKDALVAVLKELRRKYPKAVIMGHRDTSPDLNHNGIVDPWERIKLCPCFDAKIEYAKI